MLKFAVRLPEHGTTARRNEMICRSNHKWRVVIMKKVIFEAIEQSYNLSGLTCKCSAGLFHTFSFLFHPIKRRNLEADKSRKDAVNKSNGAPTVLHICTPDLSIHTNKVSDRTTSELFPPSHLSKTWSSWLSGEELFKRSAQRIKSGYIHYKPLLGLLFTSLGEHVRDPSPARCRSAWVISRFWKALCLTGTRLLTG